MRVFKVHLIKDGNIDAIYKNRYIGVTDCPLSKDSISDIEYTLKNYYYPKSQMIFSSPLKRAYDVAKLIYPNNEIIKVDGLKEYNFGEFENKSIEHLANDANYKKWIDSSMTAAPYGGEENKNFLNRIISSMEEIVNTLIKNSVYEASIITHGGIISNLLYIYGIPKYKPFEWNLNHLEGITLKTDLSLYMRNKVFEIGDLIPYKI